jgi:hypothetical protein
MREHWESAPETYFGRVSKGRILEAVREGVSKEARTMLSGSRSPRWPNPPPSASRARPGCQRCCGPVPFPCKKLPNRPPRRSRPRGGASVLLRWNFREGLKRGGMAGKPWLALHIRSACAVDEFAATVRAAAIPNTPTSKDRVPGGRRPLMHQVSAEPESERKTGAWHPPQVGYLRARRLTRALPVVGI